MKEFFRITSVLLLSLTSISLYSQTALSHAAQNSQKNDRRISTLPPEELETEQCLFEQLTLQEAAMPNSISLEDREFQYKEFVRNNNSTKVDGEITVIPVVVHIIHTGQAIGVGDNITQSQVLSAITQLNDNFRKVAGTHGDADGVDTEIEFCLASIDPDGNATDGIIRVDGSSVSGYETNGVCVAGACPSNELAVKNLSRWSNTSYYNIWVITEINGNNGGFGIQGFAYLPGSSSAYDGTVIMNSCFGGEGTVNYWNDMGRTLTHEIGHGMGLYHSFNGDVNGTTCPTGSGDYVTDTDPHKRSSSNCPSSINPCTGTTLSDVVHNFMDYSSQSCADMYTEGQSTRMNNSIALYRSSLSESTACTIDGINDLAVTGIVHDEAYQCGASYTPIVSLSNIGSENITSITIDYTIDGGPTSSYVHMSPLNAGESVDVSLPVQSLTFSAHSIDVTATPDSLDENLDNNSLVVSFESLDKLAYSLVIELDGYGSENTWEVLDESSSIVAFGGPFADGQAGITITEDVCFPDGCNQFVFYDSYGDGLESGSYVFSDAADTELASGWNSDPPASYPTPMFEASSLEGAITSVSASDMSICAGSSSVLTASGGDTYTWSTGQSSSSITVSPLVTTSYSVTAISGACSGNEVMITIIVNDGLLANLTPINPDICEGESITFNASGAGTYLWSTGETGSSISVSPIDNMTISVTPTNGCGGEMVSTNVTVTALPTTTVSDNQLSICEGSSITLFASGGESYQWNTGSTSAEMTVAPGATTSYSVTAYNGSCPGNTEEIELIVEIAPFAGPSTEVEFCSSEGAQTLFDFMVAADAGGQWYDTNGETFDGIYTPGVDEPGDYLYVLSGSGECEDVSAVMTVYLIVQPSAGVSSSISVNVNADNVILLDYLADADEGGEWTDPNGGAFDGIFDPSSDPEGMYVYAFNPDPPCNSNSAIVSVSLTGSSNAGQSTSVFFCTGDEESNLFPLLMGADVGGTWEAPFGSDFNGIINPLIDPSGEYVYSIGESSATVTVTINETPTPSIFIEEISYDINTEVQFFNEGSETGNANWSFGDGSNSSEAEPIHIFTSSGNFTTLLTIENNGCVGTDTQSVVINDIASGISEAFINERLLIYPNPGFGIFNLKIDMGEAHEIRYEVFNSYGKMISTSGNEIVTSANYKINLVAQSTGIYFLRFYADDLVVVKKLLKTN